MYERSSANVIQWTSRLSRAERGIPESVNYLPPLTGANGSAVFEAEATGKLRFISERTRMYWQRKRQSDATPISDLGIIS
jgi:hypothetical protein